MAASSVAPISTAPTAAMLIRLSMVKGEPAIPAMIARRAIGTRPTAIAPRKAQRSVAGAALPTR
jgi:hypothetical protein